MCLHVLGTASKWYRDLGECHSCGLVPQGWEKPSWLVLSSRAWRRIQIFSPGCRKTEFFLVLLDTFYFHLLGLKTLASRRKYLGTLTHKGSGLSDLACELCGVVHFCLYHEVCNLVFCFVCSPFQISLEFRNLAEKYQTVIADICQKMGCGMAEFVDKHVTSKQDWDKVSVSVSRVYIC